MNCAITSPVMPDFLILRIISLKPIIVLIIAPRDCKKYHETVEKLIVPLNGKILNKRREQMKLKSLRPWDTAVDALGKKPLAPFKDAQELIKATRVYF